jgi:hypothetical protein
MAADCQLMISAVPPAPAIQAVHLMAQQWAGFYQR